MMIQERGWQLPQRKGQSGFLAHLAHDGLLHRLADLDRAAGQPPLPAVGALLEQKAAASIEDGGRDSGANSKGAGGVTLERDHPFTLPDAVALRNVFDARSTRRLAGLRPISRRSR